MTLDKHLGLINILDNRFTLVDNKIKIKSLENNYLMLSIEVSIMNVY